MFKVKRLFIVILLITSFQSVLATDWNQKNILKGINDYRAKHGLSRLKISHTISIEARNHSQEMAMKTVSFGHDGFSERIHRLFEHFKNAHAAAENVAYTTSDSINIVQHWLESPGHRKNIEGNYNLTGIGIVRDKEGRKYVTQIFLNTETNG